MISASVRRAVSVLVVAYLLISAVELIRIALYDRPREYEVGVYPWEADGPMRFYWTQGEAAGFLRPSWGPVIRVPINIIHPDMPVAGVGLRLEIDGVVMEQRQIHERGWQYLDYYLPPLIGEEHRQIQTSQAAGDLSSTVTAVRGQGPFRVHRVLGEEIPDYVRLVRGWRRPPGPASRWISVFADTTFVPAATSDSEDERRLGVGVGEFLWSDNLPSQGIGLYDRETGGLRPFRWTAGWASLPIDGLGPRATGELSIHLRVGHPDAASKPVAVTFFWSAAVLERLEIAGNDWVEVKLTIDSQSAARGGVLSVQVDRTWNPAHAGVAPDQRDLGVALGDLTWGMRLP